MYDFERVLKNLEGKTVNKVQIHQSAPQTLYGVTIITEDGYEAWIGFPDVDQNIDAWDNKSTTDGEILEEEAIGERHQKGSPKPNRCPYSLHTDTLILTR